VGAGSSDECVLDGDGVGVGESCAVVVGVGDDDGVRDDDGGRDCLDTRVGVGETFCRGCTVDDWLVLLPVVCAGAGRTKT